MQPTNYPTGFTVQDRGDRVAITYCSRGMGFMVAFLLFFMAIWIPVGCFLLSPFLLNPPRLWALVLAKPLLVLCLLPIAATAGAVYLLLWKLFGITTFEVSQQELVVSKQLLGWQRLRRIPASTISGLEQLKDGGEGRDSFPSWELKLHAQPSLTLLSREPIDKSDWLGAFLAHCYGVDFRPAQKRK